MRTIGGFGPDLAERLSSMVSFTCSRDDQGQFVSVAGSSGRSSSVRRKLASSGERFSTKCGYRLHQHVRGNVARNCLQYAAGSLPTGAALAVCGTSRFKAGVAVWVSSAAPLWRAAAASFYGLLLVGGHGGETVDEARVGLWRSAVSASAAERFVPAYLPVGAAHVGPAGQGAAMAVEVEDAFSVVWRRRASPASGAEIWALCCAP